MFWFWLMLTHAHNCHLTTIIYDGTLGHGAHIRNVLLCPAHLRHNFIPLS